MKKTIFLEGLPGVGKTTILNEIRNLNKKNVFIVDEIVKENIKNRVSDDELDYMINDEMKIKMFNDRVIIKYRGPISTLAYNQAKNIINEEFDKKPVVNWFESIRNVYLEDHVIYFLTNKGINYSITSGDILDPYGSDENQKLLERINLYNCYKYSNNVIVREYYQNDIMEVINEIIN